MANLGSSENFAIDLVRRLQLAGHLAYFAGGCVRDRLMGSTPKDFDVATNATPEQVLALFPRSQMVGAAFGVVLVRRGKEQVEVATFRADGTYSDGRHPDAVRFTTPEEDAQRRDFTCNGLFFDPLADRLHDFVGGQSDIAEKILRAIGQPALRFGEDHLRLLRAVRFAARLGFRIEATTRQAMQELQSKIATISRERIGEEVRTMLEHPTRVAAVTLLAEFPAMFGDVFATADGEAVPAEWPVLSGLPAKTSRAVALLAVLQDLGRLAEGQPVAPWVAVLREKLMLSNEETEAMAWIGTQLPRLWDWEDLSKAALKRIIASRCWKGLEQLYCADPENADQLFAFHERVALMEEEGVAPAPLVTGDMLIAMGEKPGKAFKGWLEQLYDRQLDGELTTPEEAIAAAKALLGQA